MAQTHEASTPSSAIELLARAFDLYRKSGMKVDRAVHEISALMAREHLAAGDTDHAVKLLTSVAGSWFKNVM